MKIAPIILSPFSLLYGIVIFIRNILYDWRIIPSKKYDFPIISVGNLSVGGTGKSPHIEYLVLILQEYYHLAVLSRGYKRKTKGFLLANDSSTIEDIGDEPMQFKKKFDNIKVAVDNNRCRGVETLREKFPGLDVILLDDAFQHRSIKPGLSVLLSDFYKLFTKNYLLPSGTLREFKYSAKRADIIIVTKTPRVFSPIIKNILIKEINPKPHQSLYFSYIKYYKAICLPGINQVAPLKHYYTIILFTGIANTYPLQDHLRKKCTELILVSYPDHHYYTVKNIRKLKETFNNIFSKNKAIFTTEKDATRINKPELIEILKELPVFYLPIKIGIHEPDSNKFNQQIFDYVRENR